MPKLTIDGKKIEVEEGATILQAAEKLDIEIPIFCYHDRLSVAGNCRMCLVSVEKSPKLVASCAMPAADDMVVHTNSPEVRQARKGNLEFLLINHPLDCPICDQGGECDLQDITVAYGAGRDRYKFSKRAVPDKNFGPLIKTVMNRCIHCTRCVRFSTEIAGVQELGTRWRGEDMEIMSYLEKSLTSELSGNLIDICPVGALTSKSYAFKGRPWELTETESIDVMDAVGSNIRIDTRSGSIMRIMPRLNESVNEEWISDKTRFSFDGLSVQRLTGCYGRNVRGVLEPISWDEAYRRIGQRVRSSQGMAGLVGNLVDAEAMLVFKELMAALNVKAIDCRLDGAYTSPIRGSYLFNTTISGLEKADFCLLIGSNPRYEAPLVNTRLRKNYLKTGLEVAALGDFVDLTYPVKFYEKDLNLLKNLPKDHPIRLQLAKSKYPALIVGQGALTRGDGSAVLNAAQAFALETGILRSDWNGFNVLQTVASRVGALDLGLVSDYTTAQILHECDAGHIDTVYLLGADEINTHSLSKVFVIYQGHHGDEGAQVADIILPGAAYTEKDGLYINTEGRVQRAHKAIPLPGEAQPDWLILKKISDYLVSQEILSEALPYNTFEDVQKRLRQVNPVFRYEGHVVSSSWVQMQEPFGSPGPILSQPCIYAVQNFYMTDPISRNSKIMAACTRSQEEGSC